MLMVTTSETYEVSNAARKPHLLQTRCTEPMWLLGENTAGLLMTTADGVTRIKSDPEPRHPGPSLASIWCFALLGNA